MFHHLPACALALLTAVTSTGALAQTAATPASAPQAQATAQAPATPAPWRSPLEGYQRFSDEKIAPWSESNATVDKIGGWRAYAKEANEAVAGPTAEPKASAADAAADPHAGHGKK